MLKHNYKISIPVAILITIVAIIYQRSTGPTYPKKLQISTKLGPIKVRFPRSHGGETNAPIEIPAVKGINDATLYYKRFPTKDPWSEKPFDKINNNLMADLPNQPPAGKVQYYLEVDTDKGLQSLATADDPIILRYKSEVPAWILAPHIFFMFCAMLLSSLTGMEAIFKTKAFIPLSVVTTTCLLIGGLVLGPVVQKYAFDVYWAGFPYGYDLTDNKLLLSFLAWFIAVLSCIKKPRPYVAVAAAIILIAMYAIPHSTMGSQFNYEKNVVETDR